MSTESNIPSSANPVGDFMLDDVLEQIREHWIKGRQIVPLLGAGISVESGIPAIPALREHLLALHVLQGQRFCWKTGLTEVPVYSLERDTWVSAARLAERLPHDKQEEAIQDFLKSQFDYRIFWTASDSNKKLLVLKHLTEYTIEAAKNNELLDFAETLGIGWLELMEKIAGHRPELVDIIFDALGTPTLPNPTHNLLTHCVNWFNIRLILTTNFDKLVENSLISEGLKPFTYDIHVQAPPPAEVLVQQHLSIVKLHGNNYGLRADRSVDQPLDRGHLATLLDYLSDDVILLCLGYGGGEKRITGFIDGVLENKPDSHVIRIDPLVSGPSQYFAKLGAEQDPNSARVINLYYPPSAGSFLLHLYQYAANRLPNSRGRYPSSPHTTAPHKYLPTLGREAHIKPKTPAPEPDEKPTEKRRRTAEAVDLADAIRNGRKWAVVTGKNNCGTSQVLAQVYEKLFRSHQISWCELDEVTSVGAVLGWLHDFVHSRQPELPPTPLPFALPNFNLEPPRDKDEENPDLPPYRLTWREVREMDRVVRNVWSRLKREKFVLILDSLSCALELVSVGPSDRTLRCEREAARLLLLVAVLMKYAQSGSGKCVLLIGTHLAKPNDPVVENLIDKFLGESVKEEARKKWSDIDADQIWKNIRLLTSPSTETAGVVTLQSVEITTSLPNQEVGIKEPGYPSRDWVWQLANDPNLWDHGDSVQGAKNSTLLKEHLEHALKDFAEECAWCNRPRSWRQLIQLPSVKELAECLQDEESIFNQALREQKSILERLEREKTEGKRPSSSSATLSSAPWAALHLKSMESLDNRSRALYILVNGAMRRKWLYLQAGGFYYMDGVCRWKFRELPKASGEPAQDNILTTHRRMAAFFENSYNQSGDVTALNHYFWHTLLVLQKMEDQVRDATDETAKQKHTRRYWQAIESCLSRLLENSLPARGSLFVSDHCFLLLQIWDKLETTGLAGDNPSVIQDIDDKKTLFSKRVLNAICEVYEDNLDAQSGTQAATKLLAIAQSEVEKAAAQKLEAEEKAIQRLKTRRTLTEQKLRKEVEIISTTISKIDTSDLARAYYRRQKSYWQDMDALESLRSAHHALAHLFHERLNAAKFCQVVDRCDTLDAVLTHILARLDMAGSFRVFSKATSGQERREQERTIEDWAEIIRVKYHSLPLTAQRILFHRIILRIERSLIRIARFGECAYFPLGLSEEDKVGKQERQQKINQMSRVFLLLGHDLNLGATPTSSTTKQLTARYFSSAGLQAIYDLGNNPVSESGQKMTFYNHQAQARAMRADGVNSAFYEANTFIDEAEMLLWRARITMHSMEAMEEQNKEKRKVFYDNATARQDAAVRYFESARVELLKGSLALPSWLELTVLRTAATADILKRLTCQYLDIDKQLKVELDELQGEIDDLKQQLAVGGAMHEVIEKVLKGRLKRLEKVWSSKQDEAKREKVAIIAQFAHHAEQGAFELGHLLPLLRDDVWRGARAGVQLLRIGGYISRMIWMLLKLIDGDLVGPIPEFATATTTMVTALSSSREDATTTSASVQEPFEQELKDANVITHAVGNQTTSAGDAAQNTKQEELGVLAPLLVSLNSLIRAINNFDLGRPNTTPMVPYRKGTQTFQQTIQADDWNHFKDDLWYGISKWIGQVEKWLDRIFFRAEFLQNSRAETKWKEFPQALARFNDIRTRQETLAFCYEQLQKVNRKDSKTIADLMRAFEETEMNPQPLTDTTATKRWSKTVYEWPNIYVTDTRTSDLADHPNGESMTVNVEGPDTEFVDLDVAS